MVKEFAGLFLHEVSTTAEGLGTSWDLGYSDQATALHGARHRIVAHRPHIRIRYVGRNVCAPLEVEAHYDEVAPVYIMDRLNGQEMTSLMRERL